MTRLWSDPADFADHLLDRFAPASARWVERVPGGVIRRMRHREPIVAVVVGGAPVTSPRSVAWSSLALPTEP